MKRRHPWVVWLIGPRRRRLREPDCYFRFYWRNPDYEWRWTPLRYLPHAPWWRSFFHYRYSRKLPDLPPKPWWWRFWH